ncbi:hypothetical protein M5K25_016084 [Dendrobium thyrsiflorum]|uniref:ABC transporter domain-containing protein n=1 Tax=Dendrobium thyrsiflorum TaxID=117978 RepID=A0ABD0UZ11_DENTH
MIVGPMRIYFMDEISVGLDSSTTYQIIKCLQQIVHFGEATILMSLLQPSPEIFDLFDDIILINEGHILYQGPREFVLRFFDSCGFHCPERKSIADFMQEVISRKDQQQYWADHSLPYSYVSAQEFSNQFDNFFIGLNHKYELSIPFDKSNSHSASLVFEKHTVSYSELLSASFAKEWLLIKRNLFIHIIKLIQIIVLAFIASTLFLRARMHTNTLSDGNMYISSLTFAIIVNLFNGFPQLSLTVSRLPVFYKHRDLLLYPAWVFTLPNFVLRVPISMLESIVWVSITYYMIGFAPEASRFFKQFLLLFLMQQVAAGLFRLIAALCRSLIISSTGGSLSVVIMCVLAGFILPKGAIPTWWKWGYWISPLSYGFNALVINEFLAPRWMIKFANDGKRLGVAVLENANVIPENKWYWIGVVIYLGCIITLNVLFTIALVSLNSFGRSQAIITEEMTSELHKNKNKMEDQSISKKSGSHIASSNVAVHFIKENDNISGLFPKKGMVLPFTPLSISFHEVNYYIDMPKELKIHEVNQDRLQLLTGVTGAFRPKILTALMGVSGAGKTTLLDVLAGRKTSGYIEGEIRISGYPKMQATFTRISGYCEQNDIHSPRVTVRESLIYSAFLRLPKEVSDEKKMAFVDEVIGLVELNNLKDAIVGISGVSGLSTEQRKRLTIAVELVANPSIIFMDEPTSGLDARAAAIVMRTVRNTVDTGRTVVCTIHQPSTEIFEEFDELLLLRRGGQVIFYGPMGQKARDMIDYFEAIPGIPKIKDNYNPATWMLEVSSNAAKINLGIDLANYYKASTLYEQTKAMINELSKPSPGSRDINFATLYSQSMYEQFKCCLWKQWWSYWRNPDYNLVRFLFTVSTAFVLGSIFWNVGHKREDANGIRTVIGSMYVAVMFIGITNCTTVQSIVAIERTVFYRERAAGMYSALSYALAQALIYIIIIYPMMRFEWTVEKFMWFYYISFCSFLYFTYYGMMTISFSPNPHVASILASIFFSFFQLFSGFFIPKPKIPKWWIWYYWICPVAWTVYGLITTQYGDLDDIIEVPGQMKQPIKTFVKEHFGYHRDFMTVVAVVLLLFSFVFAFTFSFCIKKLNFQKR